MFGKVPPFCESKTAVVALVRLSRDVLLLVLPERLLRCETFVALGTPEGLVQELVGVAPRTCLVRSQLVAAICYVAAVLTSEKLWRGLGGICWEHNAQMLSFNVLGQSLLPPLCSNCPAAEVTHELFNFALDPFSILVHQVLGAHVTFQPRFVDVHISTLVTRKGGRLV